MPKRVTSFLCSIAVILTFGFPLIVAAGTNTWTTGLPKLTSSVVVDPMNGNIVYAGVTSDPISNGVWKSLDNGATWTRLPTAGIPDISTIYTLAIDPNNPQTVYVGTGKGVGKSTDGGNTWTAANGGIGGNPAANTIAINPQNSNVLYRGEGNFGSPGVRKSADGGANWVEANAGLPIATGSARIWKLVIDPTDTNTVYAATADSGMYKTTNGGGNWALLRNGISGLDLLTYSLIMDPAHPQTLYAGVRGPSHLFKTTDGGATWVQMSNGLTSLINQLAIDPVTGTLYAGQVGGGVFTSTDGGLNWSAMNTGLPTGPSRDMRIGAMDVSSLSHTLHIGTGGGEYDFTVPPQVPIISVNPLALDFHEVAVGTPATQILTVYNIGSQPLIVSDINDPFFAVSDTAFTVAPADSHNVAVTFAPQFAGPVSDTLRILSNDPAHPVTKVFLAGEGAARNTLELMDAFAGPGEPALVGVKLHNTDPVGGLQFKVVANENGSPSPHVHLNGVLSNLPSSFSVIANTLGDTTLVLIVSLSGDSIQPGWMNIADLVYHIDPDSTLQKTIAMQVPVGSDILSSPSGQKLDHVTRGSVLHIGRRGDPNHDGHIDVLDVISLINVIIGRRSILVGSEEYFASDINGDGILDILDVVRMINIVIGRATAKPIAGPTGPVRLELGDGQPGENGQFVVPLRAQFDGAVAGLQLMLRYDPTVLTLGAAQPTAHLAGMSVESQATPGTLHLLIYSLTGQVLRASTLSTLLQVPVTVQGRATGTLTLSQVVVASAQAQRVPTSLTTSTVKVSALPSAFALKPNRPNPFNPTTQIAYEVPQAAHITLAIYNILGQEVVRLVDAQHAPGRYVVRWEGRNAQGLSVASGVYLYRLTTSTGFTQTRRMTLLK